MTIDLWLLKHKSHPLISYSLACFVSVCLVLLKLAMGVFLLVNTLSLGAADPASVPRKPTLGNGLEVWPAVLIWW